MHLRCCLHAEINKGGRGDQGRSGEIEPGYRGRDWRDRQDSREAREAGVDHWPPDTRVGRDGKSYPATAPPSLVFRLHPGADRNSAPDLIAQAQRHLDRIIPLLRQMDQRERLKFRAAALRQMADAFLDDDEIKFDSPSGLVLQYWRCLCVVPLVGVELFRQIREMRQAMARRDTRQPLPQPRREATPRDNRNACEFNSV